MYYFFKQFLFVAQKTYKEYAFASSKYVDEIVVWFGVSVMRRLLTILLVLLLSLVPATALREDFLVSSQTSAITTCACSSAKIPLRLENTGDVTSVYQISQSGDAAAWAALTAQGMTLEPGDAAETTAFVSAPCNVQGSFDLQTTIKTLFDKEATLVQRVNVASCSNLYLVPTTPTSKTACPCTPAEYVFLLRNNGERAETYTISVEPADHVSLSSSRLTLAAGQEAPIAIFINNPCGVSGTFEYTLHVASEHTGWTSDVPLGLTVDACYDYNVLATPRISMCKTQGKTAHVPLTIQNRAAIKNTYDIMTRIGGTTTTYDSVTLRGGEQQVITLGIDLDDAPMGESDLTISTIPRRGSERINAFVAFNALVCEGNDGNAEDNAQNIWPIILLSGVLFLVLTGVLLRLRRRKSAGGDVHVGGPYYESYESSDASSASVTKTTKESLAKHTKAAPADLPGWFTSLLVVFIALGILALLIGALFIVDTGIVGSGIIYVDSLQDIDNHLDNFTIEPQTMMPNKAADIGQMGDSVQDVPIVEQRWFVASLMVVVFLVIVLLVLAVMLKMHKSHDSNRSDVSSTSADESASAFDKGKHGAVKAKHVSVHKAMKTPQEVAGPLSERPVTTYLLVLLALLLLSGAIFAFYYMPNYAPTFFDRFDRASSDGRIRINAENLSMYRDAIIVRTGETLDVPFTFQNPDTADAHVNLDVPVDWITFPQTALDLSPGDEAALVMTVSPDESVAAGRYRMQFIIETPDGAFQEDVVLLVPDQDVNPTGMWSWAGLITLGAIIMFALLAYRRGRKKVRMQDMADVDRPAKSSDMGTGFMKTKRLKRKKVTVYALGFLLVLLLCAGIFGILWRYTTVFGDHRPASSEDEDARTLGEILLYTTPGIHESRVTVGNDRTIIPLRITNIHDDRDYKISVYENIPWLSIDSDLQWIPPGESVVIPLVVDANRGVANGAYRISVDIRTGDDLDSIFTNDIVVVVHHNRSLSLAVLYIPYILLGILFVVYLFSTKRKLARWHRSRNGDDTISVAKKKGKTNIRLR